MQFRCRDRCRCVFVLMVSRKNGICIFEIQSLRTALEPDPSIFKKNKSPSHAPIPDWANVPRGTLRKISHCTQRCNYLVLLGYLISTNDIKLQLKKITRGENRGHVFDLNVLINDFLYKSHQKFNCRLKNRRKI